MATSDYSLSPGEAAAIVGCPTRTILTAINAGRLPARRYNARVIRTSRQHLAAWLAVVEAPPAQSAQLTQLALVNRDKSKPETLPAA